MTATEARRLLEPAVPDPGGRWLELGAGRGTFTRALAALVGRGGEVVAVEREARAAAALRALAANAHGARVRVLEQDFTRGVALPEPAGADGDASLRGLLAANALHYVADPAAVLAPLARLLRTGGRVVLVEYDRRAANRWVPHPIWVDALPALAARAGLGTPRVVARRPSAYGGELYVAVAEPA